MTKTRRVAKTRRVRGVPKKNLKSKRRGRGKVDELPFLIKTMLNNVNLKKNRAEFYEKGIVEKIVAHIPKQDVKTAIDKAQEAADKAEYERRIIAALALNQKILKTQEAEIKRLEMSGIDGPAQRTRSKARPTTNPVLEELRLEAYHTGWLIMQLQRKEQQIRNGTTRVPDGYRDYGEFLKGDPSWDMERMGYVTRFRPPGYENYDKLKSKSKSRAK